MGLSDTAEIAIGFEGAAAGSPGHLASAVLGKMLGAASGTKWGSGKQSNLLKAAIAEVSPLTKLESFNFNYLDTGLIGVKISAPAEEAAAASAATVAALKKVLAGGSTDADVAKAKNQVAVSVLESDSSKFVYDQLGYTKQPLTAEEFADAVAAVTTADVKAVAADAAASK